MFLGKGGYSYEDMDSWEKIDETLLPPKKAKFKRYYWQRLCARSKSMGRIQNNHDLYGQSDILLVADVFKNFKNRRIEIYGLDPAHFASAPGLAWQAWLKKTEVE